MIACVLLFLDKGMDLQKNEKTSSVNRLSVRSVQEVKIPRVDSPHHVEDQTVYLSSQCHEEQKVYPKLNSAVGCCAQKNACPMHMQDSQRNAT